jgi:biopolymer transport protein ExbD
MGKKMGGAAASMDMTPMIDVVFQLMIFFVVTLKMTKDTNPDVKMELTKHGPAIEKQEPRNLIVEVDKNGSIYGSGARMTKAQFRQILQNRYNRIGEFPILIRGDKRTLHRQMRDVMDICTDVGIWRISFAGIKDPKAKRE